MNAGTELMLYLNGTKQTSADFEKTCGDYVCLNATTRLVNSIAGTAECDYLSLLYDGFP